MKNRGRGRPKLSHASRKRSTIAVRLRKRERKAVEHAAGREGLKLSAWVRKTIVAASSNGHLEEKSNGLLAG